MNLREKLDILVNRSLKGDRKLAEEHLAGKLILPPHWWQTGVPTVDRGGGVYGLTVLAGQPKMGKSLVTLRSACEAALDGWNVVYIDAEHDASELDARLTRMTGTREWNQILGERFHLLSYLGGKGTTLEKLVECYTQYMDVECDRQLFCMDSVNTVTASMGGAYLACLHSLIDWARVVRRLSGGLVSFMLVSEMNTRGGIKGQFGEYAADCLLTATHEKYNDGQRIVDLEVRRRGGGSGALGFHMIDWQYGVWRQPDETVGPLHRGPGEEWMQ